MGSVALACYEKFSPIASKVLFAPGEDNCLQQFDDQQLAVYDHKAQAVVHSWLGADASTGKPSSVAVAFGWDAPMHPTRSGGTGMSP
ncbi:MAG: hypothetical protein ACYDD6_00845 [Acidimicrobiales bacterium]